LDLPGRNGFQNLTEMQPVKSKVILDAKTGRSMQTGKEKPTRQADQGLPGYPDFLPGMQEKKGNWQPLKAHDDTTGLLQRQRELRAEHGGKIYRLKFQLKRLQKNYCFNLNQIYS